MRSVAPRHRTPPGLIAALTLMIPAGVPLAAQCPEAAFVDANPFFGSSVALAPTEDLALVGAQAVAPGVESAVVFRRGEAGWAEEQRLTTVEQGISFGATVDIRGDVAAVGAPTGAGDRGLAFVYRYDGLGWSQEQRLLSPDPITHHVFGADVALGQSQGDLILVVGAYGPYLSGGAIPGRAYVYRNAGGSSWNLEQILEPPDGFPSDRFGFAIAIDQETIVVGAPGNWLGGAAYVYRFDGAAWVFEQKLVDASGAGISDAFGHAVAIHQDTILSGAWFDDNFAGSVFAFRHDGASWVEEQKLSASSPGQFDDFGGTVTLGQDIALIGAQPQTYIFRRTDGRWTEEGVLPQAGIPQVSIRGDHGMAAPSWTSPGAGTATVYSGLATGLCLEDAALVSFRVSRGILGDGDLGALGASDDGYLEVDAEAADSTFLTSIIVSASSPSLPVSRLDLTVETGIDTVGQQTAISLRNWVTAKWDLVGRLPQPLDDTETVLAEIPDPADYVRGDGRVRVQVQSRGHAAHRLRIDHVEVTVSE